MTPESTLTAAPAAPKRPGAVWSRRCAGALAALVIGAAPMLQPVSAAAQGVAAQADAKKDYVIGAGDVVRVMVFQNPDLTLETRVSESGTISYPLLGQVRLGGLSITKAEALIADGLRSGNYVRQPQITLMVTQVRGNQASVLGMVNRPGRFPIEVSGMRVSELLATAGGALVSGSDIAVLSGMRGGKPFRKEVDIGALFTGAKSAGIEDPVILDGDTLYVDRMPMIYIYGEVQRPGTFRLERDMTVLQALATGGGLTQRGTAKGLKVHRRDASGAINVFQPAMTDPVLPGDVVYVQESLF
ncbi:polysaccharide export outer membrane protein [Sphaerotilus hippei]|uniref:Polysaccharide export outer membrane protein n=1 Tax=Sphaerotilus hippei TaxID=744406 RepID=A0A318GYL8_9BURK|nr:polysaccharide export protein EpsE [Sphaerotilus hippei]PXW94951.1 polysaccharide export outer membrane protein [Sphaerotilus hippei]